MIRRLLAFLLLIVVGFTALYLATGDDSMARIGKGSTPINQEKAPVVDETEGVVVLEREGVSNNGLMASYSGKFAIGGERRRVDLPDGSIRELSTYQIEAEDSSAMRDGRQELRDVKVTFYERGGTDADPIAIVAATLVAARAIVELGKDEKGRTSIARDRDIDLFDAHLETSPEARVKNLRLDLERARVRSEPNLVVLRTERDDQPFRMELVDQQGPAVLTGFGLHASIPVQDPAATAGLEPMSVEIVSRPKLVHRGPDGDSVLQANGRLVYREDQATGLAHLTIDDDVDLVSEIATRGAHDRVTARGDHLAATLFRGRAGSGPTGLQWRHIRLDGAANERASLNSGAVQVTCAAVDVTPNVEGEPWLFAAEGQPELVQTVDGRAMRFEASERILLARIDTHLEPWLRGRGWFGRSIPARASQLLVFVGPSSLTMPGDAGALELQAASGLTVLRGDDEHVPVLVSGRGEVALKVARADAPLDLHGNRGFLLRSDHRGQHLRLGPDGADPEHRFEVVNGDLVVEGSGACRLFRPLDPSAAGEVALTSPRQDLELTLPDSAGALHRVATLQATFGTGGVQTLDARGDDCAFAWANDDEAITGAATRIWSTAPGRYHLTGAPAVLESNRGTFSGGVIHITRLRSDAVALQAERNARLVAENLESSAGAALHLDLTADQIVYLPFLSPDTAHGLWHVPLYASDRPHLLARGKVVVDHADASDGTSGRAVGDRLVLELGSHVAGRLFGSPAVASRVDAEGQELEGRAPEILLAAGSERMELLPGDGRVRFSIKNRRGTLATFGAADGSTVIECDGPVRANGTDIACDAWVEVRSLLADGSDDPAGFHLDAERMSMQRNSETGEIARVVAPTGSRLRWRRITAVAEWLELDLLAHRGMAKGSLAPVDVRMPGFAGSCRRVQFDYLTYEVSAWHLNAVADRTDQ